MTIHAEMVERINQCGVNPLRGFWGGTPGDYEMQQNPDEFARLCMLLAAMGPFDSCLEIGVDQGGSYRFLRDCVSIRNSYTVDDAKSPRAHIWPERNRQHHPPRGEFIGNSHSRECREWLEKQGAMFDLCLIDGDHSYEGVKADWELVRPYLVHDAIVWFHDVAGPVRAEGVGQLWRELKRDSSLTVLMETPEPPTGRHLGIGVFRVC